MDNQLPLEMGAGSAADFWQEALRCAERRFGREAVESWLAEAVPVGLADGILSLAVPNATAHAWIQKKYLRTLESALEAAAGEPVTIELVVRKPAAGTGRRSSSRREPEGEKPPAEAARAAASAFFAPLPLNEKYTFGNFVVGGSNRFAHAAATAVAENPGREYNPLFLYGGVGLGKTHLLHAIGHEIRRRKPRARVVYVSGETFTTHFITSLRDRREEEFRRAYRSVDIWLVDDIQFLADKSGTRSEFFHTFNELYLTNRQIVLASDRAPRELRLMEDRLRSRLESGLLVEIGPPELETRLAILQKRAALEGVEVPSEVIEQVARAVSDNIRVLEAALIRMLALASLTRRPITLELAARALGAFVQEGGLATAGFGAIQRVVCEQFRITPEELTGPRRDRRISLARQVAMYLMREMTRSPLAEIGRAFGGKTHSTVLYSCSRLEQEMQADPRLEGTVRTLRSRLAQGGPVADAGPPADA